MIRGGAFQEFLIRARVSAPEVRAWVAAGWLAPPGTDERFSEVDLARAEFICDLRRMGVNDESVPIILDLVDQLNGARHRLRVVLATLRHEAFLSKS